METIFNYAILIASPDIRRGERVNVGIAIFQNNKIDFRFSNISKLSALQSHNWIEYSNLVHSMAAEIYYPGQTISEFVERFSMCDSIIRFSEIAWFSVRQRQEYDLRIEEILDALVHRPRSEARPRMTRINSEITKVFRSAKVLAKKADPLTDHLVHRNYLFSDRDDLRADFILKNGVYNVTATLDLRNSRVDLGDAALSAVVLDKAAKYYGKRKTKKWGVYAAPIGSSEFKSEIELLSDYADKAFNWLHPDEQRAYTRLIFAGAARPNPLGINSI